MLTNFSKHSIPVPICLFLSIYFALFFNPLDQSAHCTLPIQLHVDTLQSQFNWMFLVKFLASISPVLRCFTNHKAHNDNVNTV